MKANHYFVMPKLPEEVLKKANANQLRVLIFCLQNGSVDKEALQSHLNLKPEEIEKCFNFLQTHNLLWDDSKAATYQQNNDRRELEKLPEYDNKTIAKQLKNNDYLKFLAFKTEQKMARPLSDFELRILYGAYDWLGLPIEVILIIVDYCCEMDKKNLKYFEKIALDWAKQGIDSIEAAQKYREQNKLKHHYINRAKKIFGLTSRELTPSELKFVQAWQEKNISEEILLDAYEKTIKNTGKCAFAYMNKIIMSSIEQKEDGMKLKDYKNYNDNSKLGVSKNNKFDYNTLEQIDVEFFEKVRRIRDFIMGYSKKIIETVNLEFEKKREDRMNEVALRKGKLYQQFPRLLEIERELSLSAMELIKDVSLGREINSVIGAQKQKNLQLQKERAEILVSNGYPMDYLSVRYDCEKCRDTGYIGAAMCECYEGALKKEAHKTFNLAVYMPNATFENFNDSYYSDKTLEGYPFSPRENAQIILKIAKHFANNFETLDYSLIFSGQPGLGKTFLSSAIAHDLIDRGYDVVYETAAAIFTLMEDVRFNRGDLEENKARLERIQHCDLLIMDDLGAEFVTQFVISALFDLLNVRILYHKKMIISTNYARIELESIYGPRITSRLNGQFRMLTLYGKDIRLIENGAPVDF